MKAIEEDGVASLNESRLHRLRTVQAARSRNVVILMRLQWAVWVAFRVAGLHPEYSRTNATDSEEEADALKLVRPRLEELCIEAELNDLVGAQLPTGDGERGLGGGELSQLVAHLREWRALRA